MPPVFVPGFSVLVRTRSLVRSRSFGPWSRYPGPRTDDRTRDGQRTRLPSTKDGATQKRKALALRRFRKRWKTAFARTSMFTLAEVVPWGRSFDEYCRMFALSKGDLAGRILGCADGPASFNADATRRGLHVISCDPLYRFDAAGIRGRIDATFDEMLEQTRKNRSEFVWDAIPGVDELGRLRRAAMDLFLEDYGGSGRSGRYVAAGLPSLPFVDGSFDVAVCSHFLFLYSLALNEDFH